MLLFAAMVWTTTRSLTPAPEWSVFDARVFGYDLDYAQGLQVCCARALRR